MEERRTSDPTTAAEQEYIEMQDSEHGDPREPNTFPSGDTVDADRTDARAAHDPDRPPTPDEERRAEELELDPDVAEAYEAAIERGARQQGEGRI